MKITLNGVLRDLHLHWAWWDLFFRMSPRILMWIVAAVTVASGLEYFYASRSLLKKHI